MTAEQVEIESLRGKVKVLQAQAVAKKDYEKQIDQLQKQLDAANSSNDQLSKQITLMQTEFQQHIQALQSAYRNEVNVLNEQLLQTHKDRVSLKKELDKCTKYIQEIEARNLKANMMNLDLLKELRTYEIEN